MIKSFLTAFSMYSAIPVPQVEWTAENRKYALCFFPLVGAVIGVAFMLWRLVCVRLGIGRVCFAAVSAVLPVLISGGIHFDGLIDVCDALSSHADRERKLEIMNDPHTGAFAVIGAAAYFMLYFGFMTEIDTFGGAVMTACSYIISRSIAALTITCFKCAKKDGLLFEFSSAAHIMSVRITSAMYIMLAAAAISTWSLRAATVMAVAAVIAAAVCYFTSKRSFGGITGDTAGWLVQVCELALLIAAAVSEWVM